jgi:predicted Zn finger-like uncharacterized protein
MDVRCDRCQTEYELEDDSVAEQGASVQCTTCGHTFVVSRSKPDRTPTPGPTTEMSAPAWVLTTDEGKTHRFRDPTTLQKWIVERRVGRNDRVTPPGATARRLGDMDELRPFFDLVDQADRASVSRVARPTQPETPQRLSAGARGYSTPDEDDDDVLMGGRRSRGGGQRGRGGYGGRLDSDIAAGLSTMGVDDSIGLVLPERKFGKYLARGLVLAALAVGAWFLGSKSGASKNFASAPTPAPVLTPPMPPPPAPAPVVTPTAPPAAIPPATPPVATAPPVAAAPTSKTPPPEDVAPEPLPPARQSGRAAGSADAPVRGRSYEQLVADADRALEHGNTAKAQKAIDEALRLQPNGVAVVTSNGYLLLDKQKPLAAVGEFKRALNLAPNFPQALFGLGEAYRASGNSAQAIDAYKRYVAAAPTGADAPAANRQIRELEGQAPRPNHSATANVPGQGAAPPPMPETVPP